MYHPQLHPEISSSWWWASVILICCVKREDSLISFFFQGENCREDFVVMIIFSYWSSWSVGMWIYRVILLRLFSSTLEARITVRYWKIEKKEPSEVESRNFSCRSHHMMKMIRRGDERKEWGSIIITTWDDSDPIIIIIFSRGNSGEERNYSYLSWMQKMLHEIMSFFFRGKKELQRGYGQLVSNPSRSDAVMRPILHGIKLFDQILSHQTVIFSWNTSFHS